MKRLLFGALVSFGSVGCVVEEGVETEELSSVQSDLGLILPNNFPLLNPLGFSTTYSTDGYVSFGNEFFADLGTNDRTCGTCHKAGEGWTVSAQNVRLLFELSRGTNPIFRTNDGSNRPDADVSTFAKRRQAYSMLLSRGTIRVGIGVPAGAEFELIAVDDPYGYASATELSLFRRPLPAANLAFIPAVMWDGRVTGATIPDALAEQANGATQGHAARPDPLTQETREAIVEFETALSNAQQYTWGLGSLDKGGANGSAEALVEQAFVNSRFNLFDGWQNSPIAARRAVWRGQELFNTKTRPNGGGACRGCHSAENVGTNVNGTFFNVGVSNADRRQADQPLYTFRRLSTNETLQTTDPGRALITGRWTDMNRFKVPSIRALGARAPYFHDGGADTLQEVVALYESTLGFDFTPAEEADLVAFMSAL